MRHELGHDMVAKGEVSIKKVIKRLTELVGEENVEAVLEHYAAAYGGTTLNKEEIWEEIVCDSLGDMNIFAGDKVISEFMAPVLKDIKQSVSETKGEANKTRGAPEGKASRDTVGKVAKYLPDSKVGKANREYLYHQLINLYSGISDGYADGIAIANGKTVFVVDSGRDNGKLDFGVRRIKTVNDTQLRDDFIRSTNNDTVSEGNVSDELLEKFKYEVGGNSGRDLRRESGSELSADTGKSPNKQSGVSGENADQRGLTKGKASRELDLIDYINENGDGEITAKNKPLTNREILAGALESAAKPGKELEKLQEYKKNIEQLNKKTYVLSKMKEDIKRLSFGKGNKDVAKIAELKEKAAKIERSINYYDRQLTNLEAMKPIQDLLQREKQKAYQRAAEKGREAEIIKIAT